MTDDFHPDKCLPDCMMPDGGECCKGYIALYDAYWCLLRSGPAQPVAWRWRWRAGDEPDVWAYSETEKLTDEHKIAEPLYAEPARAPEDLWVCMGCGTRKSMEQIKGEHPQALSCCPERKMASVLSTKRKQ